MHWTMVLRNVKWQFIVPLHRFMTALNIAEQHISPIYCAHFISTVQNTFWLQNLMFCFPVMLSCIHSFTWMVKNILIFEPSPLHGHKWITGHWFINCTSSGKPFCCLTLPKEWVWSLWINKGNARLVYKLPVSTVWPLLRYDKVQHTSSFTTVHEKGRIKQHNIYIQKSVCIMNITVINGMQCFVLGLVFSSWNGILQSFDELYS
jgi:hypothetical protein